MKQIVKSQQINSLVKALGRIKGAVRDYRKFAVETFKEYRNRIWVEGRQTSVGKIPINKYNKYLFITGRLYESFYPKIDKRSGFQIIGGVRPEQINKINKKIGLTFDLSSQEIKMLEGLIYSTIIKAYNG